MRIERFVVGPLETNCYFCIDENSKECVVIDPGYDGEKLIRFIKSENLTVKYILNTHGHGDHIGANLKLKEFTHAPICIHNADKDFLIDSNQNLSSQFGASIISPKCDITLSESTELKFGNYKINVLETPGHTLGSVCFIIDDIMFSGDTLFKESIGRTDLVHSSHHKMISSLKKLLTLEIDYKIFPGHFESTTLEHERSNNSFL
ncbi:MBL fold metallo-hydrolase [bacterium]